MKQDILILFVYLFYGIDVKGFQQGRAMSLIRACLLFLGSINWDVEQQKRNKEKKAQINRQMNK